MNVVPEVSVIVPVYNVEEYVEGCVYTILNQSFKNFELILIDDGSTDKSGEKCDLFLEDKRVRVIHQENQGLAEVRNIGIKNARGNYLLFVDSDDWIERHTIEQCLYYSNKYNADIICFRFTKEYSFDPTIVSGVKEMLEPFCVFDTNEALENIFFPGYVDTIAWNKFVKREMYEGIAYPKGRLREDLFTTYKIVANAKRIVCLKQAFYHYYQNQMSIVHKRFSAETYDIEIAVNECKEYITKLLGRESDKLTVGSWFRKMFIINSMIGSNDIDKEYVRRYRNELDFIKIIKSKELGIVRRNQMALLKVSFLLYRCFYKASKSMNVGKIIIRND